MNTRKDLGTELSSMQQLTGAKGKHYWRSLDEAAGSEAFQELMRREFPEQADIWPDSLNRRHFLTLMGASLALAGISGCSIKPAPSTELVPYVRDPSEIVPGHPLFFATTMTFGGSAVGLLVESHLGRPTKIEGNPEHPASRGATDIFHQASVLTLYDPDRSQTVTQLGETNTWDAAITTLRRAMIEHRDRRGAGLRLLTERILSPSLSQQLEDLLRELPDARWHVYEPVNADASYAAAQQAFGQYVSPVYDFTKADVVLSLGADFLYGPGNLQYVADFMSRRRVRNTADAARDAQMNRLYVVETAVSCTGAKADHRLATQARNVEGIARQIAASLSILPGAAASGPFLRWASAVANDLQAHQGRSLVLAGADQPMAVHLLCNVLNERLNNVGQTLKYVEPVEARPGNAMQSLGELAQDMEQGQVETLVILGGNPVYTAPADFLFAERMQKVPLRVHLSLFQDETSRQCHWHLPQAHYLEAWDDARAYDGTASLAQPLIEPLYRGRSAREVVALLADQRELQGREIVRNYWRADWQSRGQSGTFQQFWETALHDGLIRDTASEAKSVAVRENWQESLQSGRDAATESLPKESLELVFQPDPSIFDGTFANNGWLQELPKPITKLTWDNAAIVSPATAERLGVAKGSDAHGGDHGGFYMPVVELQLAGRTVRAPIWIAPGYADNTVTVALGYGRSHAGRVGGGGEHEVGFNAYRLRTSDRPWSAPGLKVQTTSATQIIACTQDHYLMENRELVRAATLSQFQDEPRFATHHENDALQVASEKAFGPLTLYDPVDYSPPKHSWGMAIDLTTCVGCNACVVACQAENNIPVVGKAQVAAGREMHWLRIDRYVHGDTDEPSEFYFQPLPCMHCENAPCEYVCPVAATVHSADGLNEMVYNRCVGTRFCSNNCPYKVRRFNFFHYADYETPTMRLQYNPDVTVRSRGVMEKCTYCVQRIRHADITSQVERRAIVDGEILTACQAACPAQAIVFGDLNDQASIVKQWKQSPLEYGLLADINTKPRTTYLAALRNPNPELEG